GAASRVGVAGVAVGGLPRGERPTPRQHGDNSLPRAGGVPRRGGGPLEQRAAPPLRQAPPRRIRHCGSASPHAHHFFAAISFITSISRSRSATSFFSRKFSASSALSRRTSSAWNVPNRLRHV